MNNAQEEVTGRKMRYCAKSRCAPSYDTFNAQINPFVMSRRVAVFPLSIVSHSSTPVCQSSLKRQSVNNAGVCTENGHACFRG